MPSKPNVNPPPRRAFFREVLASIVGAVRSSTDSQLRARDPSRLLRPPGAVDETAFNDTCRRCGSCVDACPADAIIALGSASPRVAGTPVIDADNAACVVCDGLYCTHVCPSGALRPLIRPDEIRMGFARVFPSRCVRTAGEACVLCVARCPIGPSAIDFPDHGAPVVFAEGCVGCGVCQLSCPTDPKAIVVEPLQIIDVG